MPNTSSEPNFAELLCFYAKKGAETTSPYEAQLWKEKSIPVYARIQKSDGTMIESFVKQIHFKYHKNASVTLKVQYATQKYKLINVFCDTRILYYDELYFFYDTQDVSITTIQANDLVFSSIEDSAYIQKVIEEKSPEQVISILYTDHSIYSGITKGIIRDIQQYDSESQIITARKQKIFLLKK